MSKETKKLVTKKKKNKHEPTRETRAQVIALTSFGFKQDEISTYLGITEPTLRKYYKREIATAVISANAKVASSIYNNATKNNDFRAQAFWMKCRGGWREKERETTDKDIVISLAERIIDKFDDKINKNDK